MIFVVQMQIVSMNHVLFWIDGEKSNDLYMKFILLLRSFFLKRLVAS